MSGVLIDNMYRWQEKTKAQRIQIINFGKLIRFVDE